MKIFSREDIPLVTGRANPLAHTIRLVAAQARRAPPELVLAEGVRVLEEVTRLGCRLETVLISEDFGAVARERQLLEVWMEREVPLRRCAAAMLRGLSGVVSFQGALALVRIPMLPLAAIGKLHNPLIVFLCGLQDPGNLGTILRSARAAGVSWVGATVGTVSARNPKAIRASAGAFFSLPVVEGLQPREILDYCRSADIQMYRAVADSSESCWAVDLRGPIAILLGNEARGLNDASLAGVPPLRVPMAAGVESLNVAVAGAILCFEAFRQRAALASPSKDRK